MQNQVLAASADNFQAQLALFNHVRLPVGLPSDAWQQELQTEMAYRLAEGEFIESLRAEVAPMLPDPKLDVDQFVAWFESLIDIGPGQHHRLFDWLAQEATMEELRWFLTQEAAGEAGFDDLVAYTQIRLPARAKLECARNYWDEMGHGRQRAMHSELLERMIISLGLTPQIENTVPESLALGNTMLALAINRRYAYQSVGALGVIELTAPKRVHMISIGMKRLGIDSHTRAYYDLHATLDITHARTWIAEVIRPLVEADSRSARFIAEGALMRLLCGERCFERYSYELHEELRIC